MRDAVIAGAIERTASAGNRGAGIVLLSVSHHSAPVAVRERFAFDADSRLSLLQDLASFVDEAVVISTCNRTEVYVATAEPDDRVTLALHTLAQQAGTDASNLHSFVNVWNAEGAIRHLMRVAAGLDSAILGEPQILGQVRLALEEARVAGSAGPILTRLFQSAVAAGKRARSETRISQGAGSISHAAVELARSAFGCLDQRHALAVGLGEMGQLVARNLWAHGVERLTLCNRTNERAASLAADLDASFVPWSDLDRALSGADIVISATGAVDMVISRDRLAAARSGTELRPLLIIDIAVPRDVDPAAATLPGVELHDIDGLHAVRSANLRDREAEIPRVEWIIADEAESFYQWRQGHEIAPTIAGLYEQATAVQEQELARALRQLGHLSARDQEVVRVLAHRLTRKFLHGPVTRLKAEPELSDATDVLQRLFDLPFEPFED
jgi:glutamyl-tRNA reductase